MRKWLGFLSGITGLGLLIYVFVPILLYELNSSGTAKYLSPIPEGEVWAASSESVDFTKAKNWFPDFHPADGNKPAIEYYSLSIPSLKIESASVRIGGEDLNESLVQYPGTALPGKKGNAVVFGHSILPQFFNPKDYLTIFSTLPEIKKGDEIIINYDGITYTYRVEDKFEVLPSDIQILEQNISDSYLSLVTCVPPGHPLRPKRLIVRAKIVPVNSKYL